MPQAIGLRAQTSVKRRSRRLQPSEASALPRNDSMIRVTLESPLRPCWARKGIRTACHAGLGQLTGIVFRPHRTFWVGSDCSSAPCSPAPSAAVWAHSAEYTAKDLDIGAIRIDLDELTGYATLLG